MWGLAGQLSFLNEVWVPRKFWLLAVLLHTHLFRPRVCVGVCPGLLSSLLGVTLVKERGEGEEPRAGWGGLPRAVLQPEPLQPLLPGRLAGSACHLSGLGL